MAHDPLNTLREFKLKSGRSGRMYSLKALEDQGFGKTSRLPVSLRVVLESVLRNCDGQRISPDVVKALAGWQPNGARTTELPFVLARIMLQDMAGFPALNDFAAMRAEAKRQNFDPARIEPLVPVDLVVDHSIVVDVHNSTDALRRNMEIEFERNGERYTFLKWAKQAFSGIRVVPPGNGICHQVNLEYLSR
ncbi:MAG: aconitate hydratase, partial [Rhodocyclaceae bacterium]|nr:aconitate hydratase [Rhodocyclaceae bacterium]